jgi:IAA-amino acid hydrolase
MFLWKIIKAHVSIHRCTATVDFMEDKHRPYPSTVNAEGMHHHAKEVAETLLGQDNVRTGAPLMASEDFAFYAQRFAGAYFMIGVHNHTMKKFHPLHSPYFVIDEDVLPVGAAFHAAVAMEYLNKHTAAANSSEKNI